MGNTPLNNHQKKREGRPKEKSERPRKKEVMGGRKRKRIGVCNKGGK